MTNTDTDTLSPQSKVIARAAERAAELRADGARESVIAPLLVVARAVPETIDDLLDALNVLLRDQARTGVVVEQAHREIVHLRSRLAGWKAGWLGRTATLTIPVVTLDDNGQIIDEKSVILAV